MFPDIIRNLIENSILGMNNRNAEYIMKYNPRSFFPLVDNKVLTKSLAKEYGVPTPTLYHVVLHHGGIAELKTFLKDHSEFVAKPARGSGGSGIVLVTNHTEETYITQSGKKILWEDFSYHISSILSGIYSLEGLEDYAIIESLIHPAPVFADVTYQGVPDIRIVVYKGVPVMSMVRLPTRASDGKANLHRGAIGAGISLKDGITLTAVHHSRLVDRHPDTGKPVRGITIPHWDKMLLIAAMAKDMTGLGYIGVDLVIDKDRGPVLLELNARPGLAIQLANGSGLLGRLKMVEAATPDMFETPETRVAWAKEAFATQDVKKLPE
jgi:alpha-L-glutamate ligase-like protein